MRIGYLVRILTRLLRSGWAAVPVVAVAVSYAEGGRHLGLDVPIPFLLVYAAVVFGAAVGGLRPGVVSGLLGAWFVFHSAQEGVGPTALIGGPLNLAAGTSLFVLTGLFVGHQTDRRERKLQTLGHAAAITLSDAITEGYVVVDASARVVDANDEYARLCGVPRDEVVGQRLPSRKLQIRYLAPDGSPAMLHELAMARAMTTGQSQHDRLTGMERADGSVVWVRMNCSPMRIGDGDQLFVSTVTDVTERVLEEKRAAEEHATLATILASVPSAILLLSETGTILRANEAGLRIFGWQPQELVGRQLGVLVPDMAAASEDVSASRVEAGDRHEVVAQRRDGETFPAAMRIAEVEGSGEEERRFVAIVQNISRRKELESQLLQAQRLEAVGQLAAGIAHEINTPTQFVGDNARFLRDAFADLQPLHESHARLLAAAQTGAVSEELIASAQEVVEQSDIEYLSEEVSRAIQQTLEGIERVSTIVRAMKEFSHPGTGSKELADLNRALESTATVARNEWRYAADLELDLAEDLPAVPCLVGELNQAFLNMIINAAHAIEDATEGHTKGVITLGTSVAGDEVEVRISDTGGGIPDEIRDRIFDPFFTTKGVGRGTGQGLAIARSVVVDKHGGTLSVLSEPGAGTTFVIRLPLREDASSGLQEHAA